MCRLMSLHHIKAEHCSCHNDFICRAEMVSIVIANPNNVRLSMAYQQTREGYRMLYYLFHALVLVAVIAGIVGVVEAVRNFKGK